jgi:hypothetical protein
MRKIAMLAATAAMALSLPTVSQAQVSLGLRLGYGLAMGDLAKDFKLSDQTKSQVPVQVDALYRVLPNLGVGGYFSYGFGQQGATFKTACSQTGVDCSFRDMRLGVQAIYSLQPLGQFIPWGGIGAGYEWGSMNFEAGGFKGELSYRGFEFLNLQLGGDYKVAPNFAIGPFATFSLGQYSNMKADVPGFGSASGTIDQKSLHQWLQFGIRGTFDI